MDFMANILPNIEMYFYYKKKMEIRNCINNYDTLLIKQKNVMAEEKEKMVQ